MGQTLASSCTFQEILDCIYGYVYIVHQNVRVSMYKQLKSQMACNIDVSIAEGVVSSM